MPVVESMPDPLVIDAIDPSDVVESVATTSAPEPAFTPLALAEPPVGYELESATILPGAGTGVRGLAIYTSASSTTQIWLHVSNSSVMFDQLPGLGRTSWQVGDVTVYDDGEGGGGCLVDVCSIGWAWDDDTFVSLKWVEPNAGTLAAGATHATLLELVPQVVERADIWELDDLATPPTTAPSDDVAEVLLPGDGQEVETAGALVAGPGGTSAAALLAPDGSMVIVRLLPNEAGYIPDFSPADDVRSFGDFDLLADAAGQITLYESVEPCWTLTLLDGGSVGADESWRDVVVEVAGAFDVDDGGVSIRLPAGWTNLGLSGPAALHEVRIRVPGESGPASVQVTQGPGSAVAFTNALAGELQVVSFLSGDAWAGITSIDPVVTTVLWQRAGTSYVATSEQLDVGGIEAVVAGMEQGSVADWNDRFGAVEPAADELTAGPGCPMPTLSISGG